MPNPMADDDPRHGTYAGAQTHRRQGSKLCDPCQQASTEYMARWRSQDRTDWRAQHASRWRALTALARLHPEDFERLYIAERMKDRAARR